MANQPKPFRMLRDVLDLAIQTGAPLIVRRRCNPHQLAVWLAVRFLMDTTERTAFGSREIADETGLKSHTRVTGWLNELVELQVLELAGSEKVPGMERERPIYRIPWKHIISESLSEAEKYVAGSTAKRKRGRPLGGHELQLPMDFPVIDREQITGLDQEQITGLNRSQLTVPDRSQPLFPIDPSTVIDREQLTVPDRSHGMEGRIHGRMDGSGTAAKKKKSGPPEELPALTPPDPAPEEAALPAHPLTLWRDACPRHRPIDDRQLAALASEHDPSTGGYGLYWVGRAILAASLNEDVRQVAKVRNILDRWRSEASYGSDLPQQRKTYARSAQPNDAAHRPRRSATSSVSPERDAELDRLIADAEARANDEDV